VSVVASGSRGASRIIRPVFIASEVRTQQTTTPHHHRSIFFLPPWKNWPPLSVIVQQREGENLNYQGQVLPFLMPFYNGKNSHSVFATARIAPQHTEKDRFL
jgi:hypothetical protein